MTEIVFLCFFFFLLAWYICLKSQVSSALWISEQPCIHVLSVFIPSVLNFLLKQILTWPDWTRHGGSLWEKCITLDKNTKKIVVSFDMTKGCRLFKPEHADGSWIFRTRFACVSMQFRYFNKANFWKKKKTSIQGLSDWKGDSIQRLLHRAKY